MQLTVSGVKKEYEDGITLDQKETYQLKDGDNVEFLYFMGGGQR